jgi:hypothetical protein
VEALGLTQEAAEALGIGYASKGMMKGYVAIPIRLPTGELTGYIGIPEAKLPKEFHFQRGHISKEDGLGRLAPRKCGAFFARLQRDRSRQAARMRVLTRRQSSPIACHSRQELFQSSRSHLS